MAPAAVSPVSPPSPTLDNTSKLTKAGTATILEKTISNGPKVADLEASKLTFTPNLNPKPVPAPNSAEVWSQNYTTDHMLTVRWTEKNGWEAPEIRPYGPLSIMPTASVLHYATECFEGMKAYRGDDGKVRLFRPDRNARRFLQSATRISLPGFPPEEFLKLLKKFVGVEAPKWISEPGSFIYIRPTMIATAPALGVQRPKEALMYIMMVMFPSLDDPLCKPPMPAPSAASASNGVAEAKPAAPPKGMRLLASKHDMIRAWPGGFGNAKVGANYGPSLVAQGEARARGYDQILWLFGEECFVTEAGGSNFFVLWKDKTTGRKEMVTAPLGDGVILEGVTRASVLDLVRSGRLGEDVDVTERRFTMQEVIEAQTEGRLIEAFGAGTAFFIAPVQDIHFRGLDLVLPLGQTEGKQGDEFAMKVKRALKDIMYGQLEDDWGVVVEETRERTYDA
ncbi:branched-chain amino acid aminotransferase [Cladophialophora yegresii CBS 114405]|uniref:Branched-chain-amino-acid aminotransferase n=1 Tax=Cladophialophora yegresii CBS 114405 TaxID=1182544 RepID=W9VSC4_9EURO|nr:branched-chain amino acid aminotransferase [Cladophialophora yegresii CBS 114405]EXJ58647.1 branched-chain amino acid aminotransferase [Cladophialophora yegresii CBS 114405]